MKTLKTVLTLKERAERNGEARVNRDGFEVYRVENNGKTASLFHYETLTAEVDLENQTILEIYGESVTDADSVGTFLNAYGFNIFFGFRPVNGGFYAMVGDETFFVDELGVIDFTNSIVNALKK